MDQSKWPAKATLPIARPGLKFIILAILITGVFFYFGKMVLGFICLGLTVFTAWFFRDPQRTPPPGKNNLISPADGKVIVVDQLDNCDYLDGPCKKISIFMNVFNVHVNRMPYDGEIETVQYHPGKFMNASFDKASIHNERNALIVRAANQQQYAVVQIAGLVARRIVNCVTVGDRLKTGERYGMIQFGSRLDLYLPVDFNVAVQMGDKTIAGVTIIGQMS
jgi:phosphatidylserine decarboxylase